MCLNATSAAGPLLKACEELAYSLTLTLGVEVPLFYGAAPAGSSSSGGGGGGGVLAVVSTGGPGSEQSLRLDASPLGDEAYIIEFGGPACALLVGGAPSAVGAAGSDDDCLGLSSPTGRGVLFGAYRLLSAIRRGAAEDAGALASSDGPRSPLRIWQLWDNLDGTIERGWGRHATWQQHRGAGACAGGAHFCGPCNSLPGGVHH